MRETFFYSVYILEAWGARYGILFAYGFMKNLFKALLIFARINGNLEANQK